MKKENLRSSAKFIGPNGKQETIHFIKHQYKFTKEENDQIRQALRKMGPERVEQFMTFLEFHCHNMKEVLESPEEADLRIKKEDILKSCKKTLGYLTKIEHGRLRLATFRKVPQAEGLPEPQDAYWDQLRFISEYLKRASDGVGPLRAFVELIEENLKKENPRIGRKGADEARFIRNIAESYETHIGKPPSTYKEGPFMEVVRKALGAVGLPSTDPSRAVKVALNARKNERMPSGTMKSSLLNAGGTTLSPCSPDLFEKSVSNYIALLSHIPGVQPITTDFGDKIPQQN